MATVDRIKQLFNEHLETLVAAQEVLPIAIASGARLLVQCLLSDHKILSCGNGGSAADAQHFASELINRFDAFVTFRALTTKEIGKIFDILLGELNERLTKKGLSLIVTAAIKRHLVKIGHDEKFGARPLRRTLQNYLEHPIAEGIIDGKFEKGTVLEAALKDKKVVINAQSEE